MSPEQAAGLKWWEKYPMHPGLHVLLWVCVAVVGYAAGRFTAPSKVIDQSAEMSALRQERDALREENKTLRRHTVKLTTETFSPEGKIATKTVQEDTHVDLTATATTAIKINTDATAAKLTTHIEERKGPTNILGLIGDTTLQGRWAVGPQYQHLFGPIVVGVHGTIAPPRALTEKLELRVGINVGFAW